MISCQESWVIGAMENYLSFLWLSFACASWLSISERQRPEKRSPSCLGKLQFFLGKQIPPGCLAPDLYLGKPHVPVPLGQAQGVSGGAVALQNRVVSVLCCSMHTVGKQQDRNSSSYISSLIGFLIACFVNELTTVWLYLPEIMNSYNIVQVLSISFFLRDEIGSGYQLFVL